LLQRSELAGITIFVSSTTVPNAMCYWGECLQI